MIYAGGYCLNLLFGISHKAVDVYEVDKDGRSCSEEVVARHFVLTKKGFCWRVLLNLFFSGCPILLVENSMFS